MLKSKRIEKNRREHQKAAPIPVAPTMYVAAHLQGR
jgi:hypothetical protein